MREFYQKWSESDNLRYAPPDGRCAIEPYQERFIELLAEHDVIRFGEFTLKSGRTSPYFINAGQLRTGRAIAGLGRAYAERISERGLPCDLVFGPSYKGVPLAVATAMALSERGRDVGFCFDRKGDKDHGEGGIFVGAHPEPGMDAIVVDDVITSGASIRHSVALLSRAAELRVAGIVIAVDRQERGRSRSTLIELEEELSVPVLPIVTVRDVLDHLSRRDIGGSRLVDETRRRRVEEYLDRYGAGGT